MNVEPWASVSIGENSNRVRGVQYLLRQHGHALAADGVFGPVTQARVVAFQATRALPETGQVDPTTWPQLVVATAVGSTGDAVRGLQSLGLVTMIDQPALAVDGQFGPVTRARVVAYQRQLGLGQDGAAGRETWSFGTAAPWPWPLVKVGQTAATNVRVPMVQHLLRHHGAGIVADGSYGPLTGEAVRQFQLTLRATDIGTTVGQLDWPELIVTVQPGDAGEHVRAVQCVLPGLAVDGVYGPLTRARVEELQQVFGGTDGIVEHQTWRVLIGPVFE